MTDYMMRDDIAIFSMQFGPSGSEGDVREKISAECNAMRAQTVKDTVGNLYAMLPATDRSARRTPIVLSAHMDEIGLMISRIDDGIAYLSPIGTWRADALLGQRVVFKARGDGTLVDAHIGMAPVHWAGRADKRAVSFDTLWADLGSGAPLLSVGDVGVLERRCYIDGNRVIGKALDNRAGCCAVLSALRRLESMERKQPVIAIFTANEETSGTGAHRASHAVREIFHSVAWPITSPARCCVVDATFATDDGTRTDEKNCQKYGPIALGAGPVLCPTANTTATALEWLSRKLAARGPYQSTPYANYTDTDADTFGMVPWLDAVLLSYPLRNMHSPVEIIDARDLQAVADTLVDLCSAN